MPAYSPSSTSFLVITVLATLLLALWAPRGVAEPDRAESQAAQGEKIAEQICTTCHQVPDHGGPPVGPEFRTLAERRGWTAQELGEILSDDQHKEVVPASELDLEAVASYLNRLDSQ